ncbi:NAD-dependent epimerase/dehydratase family protein [Variovorax sp. M-6]|uniref:NAD-dependent epimerase/dehydratase family protein n=1 Tax=Variovorax sp. M-6 TaxID=3233041 RepID=UPI003F978300
MRVLVTGASGFLGRAVLQQLQGRGLEVFAVSRSARPRVADAQGIVLSRPDDAEAVRATMQAVEPQIVMHLAGISSAASYSDLYRANVVFAANLLDASAAMPVAPRVLLVGSAAEYGPVPEAHLPVTEDFACRPNTAYGISKLAQTNHALAAAMGGLPVAVARLFNPIGAGMPRTLALGSFADQIAKMGRQGGELATGDLDVVRDFIDVDVAAAALVEVALKHRGNGEIVNVCSGRGQSLLELTQRLIAVSGVPVSLRHDASRRGNSNVRSFVGNPGRLQALGFSLSNPDIDALLTRILEAARAQNEST